MNGHLSDAELVTVQTGTWLGVRTPQRLIPPVANAFRRTAAAAAADGAGDSEIAAPDGAYRTHDTMVEMRADYFAHNWLRHNLDEHATIPPSIDGTHGDGDTVDVWGKAFPWWVKHAHEFGWRQPFPIADPHHFVHDRRTATAALDEAALTTTEPENPDMARLIMHLTHNADGSPKGSALYWQTELGGLIPASDEAFSTRLNGGVPAQAFNDDEIDGVVATAAAIAAANLAAIAAHVPAAGGEPIDENALAVKIAQEFAHRLSN